MKESLHVIHMLTHHNGMHATSILSICINCTHLHRELQTATEAVSP